MAAACDLLEAELALDRLEAALAAELPGHLRAFAAAHAAGSPPPPAPPSARRLAAVQHALAHPVLADRALALARLVFPIVIDDDRRVVAASAVTRTWDAWEALAAARDAAARERFGIGFIALMHRLYGVERARGPEPVPWPAPLAGWHDAAASLEIDAAWRELAARHGARGTLQLVHAEVRARTFVVEPRQHVIVVAPTVTSLATKFAVLHELGHALVGLLVPAGVPRVVDEAAASYIARGLERDHELGVCARQRRLQLAMALDVVERGLSTARPTEYPPWALWHDPGAQAAYVEAEAIADRWCSESGPLGGAITRERARIDATTSFGQ